MLAGSITPRPRPPARTRRASSQVKSSPPPPYRPSLPDGPLTPSDHARLSPIESLRGDWPRFPSSGQPEQWNERSREDLTNLLHKADGIIKDRELELNVTSAVCKTLYENNLELKSRHQALLARLPPSPASSSPGSLAPSPTPSDLQLPQSPHYYSADESRASSNASVHITRPRPHYRRVSVSPADLALLSDQNAELLAKLEKLEAESIHTDQAGRRKLRSLEKEIQGLRDELDRTRARSDELEKKARIFSESAAFRDEEVDKRRREREERLRVLRNKPDSGNQDNEIRDFAPGGALSVQHGSKNRFTPRRRHISEAVVLPQHTDTDERPRRLTLQTGLSRSASLSHHFRFPASAGSPVPLTHEYALVSQLLLKIQELEETNAQITEQQARTAAQLQNVQKDATSLRLAYESLGDGEGVEWISEESERGHSAEDDEANETIRFSSLRRTLSADASVNFAGGIDADMRSSLKQPVLLDHVPVIAHPKIRRSVVGLFDSPRKEVATSNSSISETATPVLDMMIPGLPPVPFVPQPSNTSASTPTSGSPSPILSLSLTGTLSSSVEVAHRRPTLDSELGAAFDGHWDGRLGLDGSTDDHFRTSSIVDLSSISPGTANANSTVPTSALRKQQEPECACDVFMPAMTASHRSTAFEPRSWHDSLQRSVSSGTGSQSDSPAEKKRRKSQTIRLRAAHWKEGRFGGTLIPIDKRTSLDISRPPTPVPERLASAFEAIVNTMSRSNGEAAMSLDLGDDKGRSTESAMTGTRSRGEMRPPPRQRGIVAFVLEIWLWLQFAIIVVVFVWAMARRGPKSVLEEAGRRKTGSLKR